MTTNAIPADMTAENLKSLLDRALLAAQDAALEVWPHGEGCCGFAWTSIQMRKNGRLHKVLKEFGFSWSDYEKAWSYRACNNVRMHPGTLWQSLDYRAKIDRAFSAFLKEYGIQAYVGTLID
jgi:hypothetical protein